MGSHRCADTWVILLLYGTGVCVCLCRDARLPVIVRASLFHQGYSFLQCSRAAGTTARLKPEKGETEENREHFHSIELRATSVSVLRPELSGKRCSPMAQDANRAQRKCELM
eukprot:6180669-Pleurochrysis_carterae.AAC.6